MRKTGKRDKTGHVRKIQYITICSLIVMIAIVTAVMVNIRHLYGQKEDEKQEKIQIVQTEQDHKDITRLREQLIQYIKENESSREDVGFYIEDLESGDSIELNGDQLYVAASTYKLPLAMVYYDHINAGEMSAEEYEDLLNSMIVNSDNEAAE
ncbi:serine hydrolase, partial [uncultured Dubosiella sp.]